MTNYHSSVVFFLYCGAAVLVIVNGHASPEMTTKTAKMRSQSLHVEGSWLNQLLDLVGWKNCWRHRSIKLRNSNVTWQWVGLHLLRSRTQVRSVSWPVSIPFLIFDELKECHSILCFRKKVKNITFKIIRHSTFLSFLLSFLPYSSLSLS